MGYSVTSTAGLAYYVSQVYVEPEEPLGMLSITVRPNLSKGLNFLCQLTATESGAILHLKKCRNQFC